MNKKLVMIIISIILLVCIVLVKGNFTKNKKVENIVKEFPEAYTYKKSEEGLEDLYIIYDEQGNEIMTTEDEKIIDAQMHLYEIDPDYDG